MEVEKISYTKAPLNAGDIEEARVSLYELVHQARTRAMQDGIKANSILINKNMVRVPSTVIVDGVGGLVRLPDMVCGLNVYFTKDELPENYSFAVFNGRADRLAQFEMIGMEPDELRKAAELYRRVKEVMGDD